MKAFKLKVDLTQCVDDLPNIHRIKQNDYLDLSQILASDEHAYLGSEIICKANFSQLSKFDFIYNDLNVPILSQKFIDQIQIHLIKEICIVPIKLIDDTYLEPLFSIDNTLKKDLPIRTDFFTLKFIVCQDYCDQERSTFRKIKSKPEEIGILRTPVLREPKNGFPKIFRIKESVSLLFVSEITKSIVESAEIKGCIFEEVETI